MNTLSDEERARLGTEARADCRWCSGRGWTIWPTTAMGIGSGIGGATMTPGPCRCTATWQHAAYGILAAPPETKP